MSERYEHRSEEELMSLGPGAEGAVADIMGAIRSGENFVIQVDPSIPPEFLAELLDVLEKAGVNPTVMDAE